MKVPEGQVKELLLSDLWSTSQRHRMVQNLGRLPAEGGGPAAVVEAALTCSRARQTVFLNDVLDDLVEQHAKRPFTKVQAFGRAVTGVTGDGTIVFVAPVDYVSWTAPVEDFATRPDLPAGPKVIVLPAGVSDAAKSGFERAGWTVVS